MEDLEINFNGPTLGDTVYYIDETTGSYHPAMITSIDHVVSNAGEVHALTSPEKKPVGLTVFYPKHIRFVDAVRSATFEPGTWYPKSQ